MTATRPFTKWRPTFPHKEMLQIDVDIHLAYKNRQEMLASAFQNESIVSPFDMDFGCHRHAGVVT